MSETTDTNSPTGPSQPWTADVATLAGALGTDIETGLDATEAEQRIERYGRNELEEGERTSTLRMFLSQFANTMIVVLGAAAVVTLVVGDRTDTVVITAIVVVNAAVGFAQEYRAEQAMAALHQMTARSARVVRNGTVVEIDSATVVPGDLVRLTAGDVIPADLRLYEVHGLRIDEAALTGESVPVDKTGAVLDDPELSLSERRNLAYKGTAATYGRATGIVVATGMTTELGRIAQMLTTGSRGATPLQRRLAELGRRLAAAALVVCAAVFVVGLLRDEPVEEMFLTAVSLAVAAVPEGLPAVVTVSLALGARRMADRHALIRRLPAVETLGSVTVICTDKTGTLTENRMTVERVWTPTATYEVSGEGYAPVGDVIGPNPADDEMLAELALVAARCNDAVIRPSDDSGGWALTGDPTEGALLALAGRLGVDLETTDPRAAEVPFDSDRRRMVTIHPRGEGFWVAAKGAPEAIAEVLSSTDDALADDALAVAAELTRDGYRVLALASRTIDAVPTDTAEAEGELRLLGIVGIADPPRAAVASAVERCRAAGITPVMITGDHPRTAASIGRRLGLLDHDREERAVMTGAELAELSDDELADRIGELRIFARTAPEQKMRIVDAWSKHGAIVAMTGDGVNDAPALRRADIGVAMGITGTDVSQEAADMVLADDDFATIVAAVEEGRRIYDNIRRFVRYLLTTNTGEVSVMLLAPLFGLPLPLTAAQILWINLVTDGLPAVALGLEPAEDDAMDRPPRRPGESILARGLWQQALSVGLFMAVLVLALQALTRDAGWASQTMVFTTLSLLQLGNALATRSEKNSFFRLGIRTNLWLAGAIAMRALAQLAVVYVPVLQRAFDTEALSVGELAVVLVVSTGAFVAVELDKWRKRRRTAS